MRNQTGHMRKEKFWREHLRIRTGHMRNLEYRQEHMRKRFVNWENEQGIWETPKKCSENMRNKTIHMRQRTSHMRNSEMWQEHMRKGTGHMRKIFTVPYAKVVLGMLGFIIEEYKFPRISTNWQAILCGLNYYDSLIILGWRSFSRSVTLITWADGLTVYSTMLG